MNVAPSRRSFLKTIAASCMAAALPGCASLSQRKPPNIVLIFLDDSGWGDYPPFGSPEYPSPNVQQLAAEGCQYNRFYVPQAICSASRASLLTGCYPGRTQVFGAHPPEARGLEPSYTTMGQVMQANGYKTAIFGKWHCGDQPDTRPPARGFDESCGLMYSNDMWEFHPGNPEYWGQWPLQFWENGEVTIDRVTPKEQEMLTTWYTEHAVDFINRHKDESFFLYVPHSMPHVPLYCSDKFKGKSGVGLYGDVMMELDWSIGRINQTLAANGLEQDTIVILTSDNGPWVSYGNHAGVTPWREAKATSFDGGTRSACVIKYPGKIKAGSTSERMFCSIDLLPTLCHLTGAALPDGEIDGRNVWDLVSGVSGAENPHNYYAFSTVDKLESIMSGDGRWKLHLPHTYRSLAEPGADGMPGRYRQTEIGLSLFDMKNDPHETTNMLAEQPDVAARLQAYAEAHTQRFYMD